MSGQEQVLGLKEWYSLQVPEQHLNIEGLVEPTSGIKRQEGEESEGGSSDVGVRGLQPLEREEQAHLPSSNQLLPPSQKRCESQVSRLD